MSRIHEEWENTGDNTLAVANGLQKTGMLITGAAAIMVVVAWCIWYGECRDHQTNRLRISTGYFHRCNHRKSAYRSVNNEADGSSQLVGSKMA